MGLRRKSGKAPQDETTKSLLSQGVYRVDVQDHEVGLFHRHAPFSFWSGVRYVLVLSVLLWWLPTVGQMISGYVGGRRTGAPWKGALAAIIPLAVIFAAGFAIDHGYFGLRTDMFSSLPTTISQGVSGSIPAMAPYVDFVVQYVASFVVAMSTTLSLGSNGYLVTIIFAYIGGIMAEQARRETSSSGKSGVGVSISQPVVHHHQYATRQDKPQEDRSMIRIGRKEPVELASMKKIPATYSSSVPGSSEPRRPKPSKAEPSSSSAVVALQKQGKGKHETPKARSEHDEVRIQHFVDQALSRYETKRH